MEKTMTKGKAIDLEGFVIRVSDYKETDCIINFLCRDGVIPFRARGIKKPTSKNHILSTLLVKAKLTLLEEADKFLLKESKLVYFPDAKNDFLTSICFQFLNELNAKIFDEGRALYPYMDFGLSRSVDNASLLAFCTVYFAQFLKSCGYGLNVDECVFCHKKTDIVGISMINGGFICRDDVEYESEIMNPRFLKIIRFCFRCEPKDINRLTISNEECIQVISFLSNHYEESTGVKIKSLEYLRKAL